MLVYDTEGNEHEKEGIDARECVRVLGWTFAKPEPEPELEEEAKSKKAAK